MKDIDGYVTKDNLYRLISRIKRNPDFVIDDKTCDIIIEAISDMSKADVQPVKRGKWCQPLMGQGKCSTYCSRCFGTVMRNSTGIFEETPFCPHCGADMRELNE